MWWNCCKAMRMSRMVLIITLPPVSASSCLISVLSWSPYSILQFGSHTSYSILHSGKLGNVRPYVTNTIRFTKTHFDYLKASLTYSTAHKDTCQVRSIETAFWQTWGTQIDSCLSPICIQTHINIFSHIYMCAPVCTLQAQLDVWARANQLQSSPVTFSHTWYFSQRSQPLVV